MHTEKILASFSVCVFIMGFYVVASAEINFKEPCIEPSTFDFSQCKLPILNAEKNTISTDFDKKNNHCNQTSQFLNCMHQKMKKLCNNSKNLTAKTELLFGKINKAIQMYKLDFDKNCKKDSNWMLFLGKNKILNISIGLNETNQKTESDPLKNKTKSKTNIQTELTKIIEKEQNTSTFLSQKINLSPKIRQLAVPKFSNNSSSNLKKLGSDELSYKLNRFEDNSINYSDDIENNTYENDENLLEDECESGSTSKCESRSLHITCGYPAANPKSNLNAYCNELKHYIHCAKCKTINCKMEGSIISIKKHLINQEASFYDKCVLLPLPTTTKLFTYNYFSTKNLKPTTFMTTTTTATTTTRTTPVTTTTTTTTTTTSTTTSTTSTKIITTTTTASTTITTTKPTSTITTSTSATISTTVILSTTSATSSSPSSIKTSLTKNIFDNLITESSPQSIQKDLTSDQNIEELESILFSINSQKSSENIAANFTPIETIASTMISKTKSNNVFKIESNNNILIQNTTQIPISTEKKSTSETSDFIFNNSQNILNTKKSTLPLEQFKAHINTVLNQGFSKIRNNPKNKSVLTTIQNNQFVHSFLKQIASSNENNSIRKIDYIQISFDHIDLKTNTLEVSTSKKNLFFSMKINNRTDIFKGIKNGAVYLHSKTSFILNLNEYASDLCLTSSINKQNTIRSKKKVKGTFNHANYDLSCENGWTISFWIKVSNLNLFDKTILKVDNLINNQIEEFSKFFVLKLSNFDIKIQFLYKKKLWTVNQNLIWKSEWTMLTLTWSEFEGITIYLNDKKLLCQQMFEYYVAKEENDIANSLNNNDNMLIGGKVFSFETNSEREAAFEKLRKRSRDSAALAGQIYVGLNNNVNRFGRKLFWSYRDDSSNSQQNILLASTFSEAILLDELSIINYKMTSKEIMQIYFREYIIKNEYDSVEEIMLLTSTDNKQAEVYPLQGANIKNYKDNSYLSLSGDKQFVIAPNLFDSCILDAENLCTFGFTATLWLKFTYNFVQYPIQKTFEQILFFFGSQDFTTGLEGILYVHASNEFHSNEQVYSYVVKLNFKSKKYIVTKSFKVNIKDIIELNNLNCLTVQFGDVSNLTSYLRFNWLNYQVEETESLLTATMNENNFLGRSFSSYSTASLGDFGLKVSVLSNSNSIGIFGDISKQSYFNIKNFELKNYEASLDTIEYEFYSANPVIYHFNSMEKLFKMPHVNIIGSPQIVDTRYGRSLLFSKPDQKLVLTNVTNSCFGDLNLCKNGYTLKFWVCFTNYNNIIKSNGNNNKLYSDENFQQNASKRIYLLTNSGEKFSRKGMAIIYDMEKNQLIVYAKTVDKWYRAEITFRLKLYVWYIITVTWENQDGLRLYINNRLLDHAIGNKYDSNTETYTDNSIKLSEFTLGKGDHDFDEIFDETLDINVKKNPNNLNFLDAIAENQTEDSARFRNNLNKNRNYQINSLVNNYYEFIIHKMVQYDVRKYPDEIITKSIIVQEKKPLKIEPSMNWLWYTISGSFLVIGFISLIILAVVIKRRASNGFWSREHDLDNVRNNKKKKKSSKFCCSSNGNDEDSIESAKNNLNLELKQCHLNNESFSQSPMNCDEYSTNSLYGTIDRLIVKKSGASCSSSNKSAIMYTNNYNSITKDPKMRNSTSYIINNEDDLFEKSEIHF